MNLRDKPFVSYLSAALRGIIGRDRHSKDGKAEEAGNRPAGPGGGSLAGEAQEEKKDSGTGAPVEGGKAAGE